ncbi:MAG: hypothetical protein PUA90_04455 [bacterium]|nr:hypothetical protein [bacterium]
MNIDKVLETFIEGDYLLVFLALMLIILVVLIISLIKSRQEYNDLLDYTNKKEIIKEPESLINEVKSLDEDSLTDDLLKEFDALKTSTTVEEEKPIIKQVNLSEVKTYNDIIDEYESSEEENAVISAEELERRTKERIDELGSNDNQVAIAKYEEEQEKKAIISYEQLLKNASNITLSYKEEEKKDKEAPRINKIEVEQKEVIGTENYLEEEEFLKILKEFRMTL